MSLERRRDIARVEALSFGRRWLPATVVAAVLGVLLIIIAPTATGSQSTGAGDPAASAPASPYTQGTTWVVNNSVDSGPGTLRDALEQAAPGDTITFDPAVFPPANPVSITLTSGPLPSLSQGGLTLDASQAGVILDGSELEGGEGLLIDSDANRVRGLQVRNFPGAGIWMGKGASHNQIGGLNATPGGACTGDCNLISGNGAEGMVLDGTGVVSNTVSGNYIGTDLSGTSAQGNAGNGITIAWGAQHNRVGGSTPGERNLISGNGGGVAMSNSGTISNTISGNYIGTDVTGNAALGNRGPGVSIGSGAQGNLVGGEAEGERNLISGNMADGVSIWGNDTTGNTVRGNWIGLYLDEARQAFPTDLALSPDYARDCTLYVATSSSGVHKSTDCGESWVEVNKGLTESQIHQIEIPPAAMDAETAYALAHNGHLFATDDGAATWRLVGDALASADVRNLAFSAAFATDQTIYASAADWAAEALGGRPGVFKSTDNGRTWTRTVEGLGDDHVQKVVTSPDRAAAGTLFALTLGGIERSTDGGATWGAVPSPDADLSDLALSPAYARDGTIFVTALSGRVYTSTDGGETWRGVDALRDQPAFLAVSPGYARDQTVCHGALADEGVKPIACSRDGGTTWAEMPTGLLGHRDPWGRAIALSPGSAADPTIFVISVAGMARSGDGGASWEMVRGLRNLGNVNGVWLGKGASYNIIGPGNVLSNNHAGVVIWGGYTAYNLVAGNLIGTDPAGTHAQANSTAGVEIHGGYHNQVGGSSPADGNLISGNRSAGVWLAHAETVSNTISGNYIGTNLSGTSALSNVGGVVIFRGAQDNLVGGRDEGESNLISGNEGDGVFLGDDGTANNTVRGNLIGTDAPGTGRLGNMGTGISINWGAGPNTLGPDNTIAYNDTAGVAVFGNTTRGNHITQNIIYDNLGGGIHNVEGGNAELPPPAIAALDSRSLQGSVPPGATVEIFSDEGDQGRILEGSVQANGEGRFAFSVDVGRITGPNVTTTTTDAEGNTSEFSPVQSVPAPIVTRELPGIVAPVQASVEPEVLGTNLGLAIFSVLFFGLTTTVLNSILEDYRDEMLRPFRALPQPLARPFIATDRAVRGLAAQSRGGLLVIWLLVLILTAAIESFLDPELRVLSPGRLGLVATLFISAVFVSGLELGSDLFAHRRLAPTVRAETKVQWLGILIAVACVILSRALDFRPGYLFGIVGSVYLLPKLPDIPCCGKRALLVLLTLFAGGFLLWIVSAFLPAALVELEPILLTIFLLCLQGVFFELFPLSVTEGGDIWSWRKVLWLATFALVFFCFYHFLLNPNASGVQALEQNGVQALWTLILVFGLATVVLWLLFPLRLHRRRAGA